MNTKCSQCGADLELVEDEYFIACPYCNTSLYFLMHQSFPHYIVPAFKKQRYIRQIIKDFQIRFNIKGEINQYDMELFYFPFWKIELHLKGKPNLIIQLAVESHLSWLRGSSLLGADLKFFSEKHLNSDDRVVEPNKSHLDILNELFPSEEIKERDIKESLIHYPFIRVDLNLAQEDFSLWIDASHRRLIAFEPDLPSPLVKRRFSQKLFFLSLGIFTLEGILIPGFWKLPAFALSFFILYHWSLSAIRRM